ncbi:tubulin polyglutamylase complex subunit 1-like isoform X2 [Lytechinus variegatus]|uniref:tubulin polyglutamylase complex subunit 1-like isoform X2 n=1 Tax=Lytechinus variegatus TaxID=7654 RepID=UPI001BB11FC0|nr:tubulin polyglutamylase complex subunit 1-like isoform X2 [Lytechinus variegatus]
MAGRPDEKNLESRREYLEKSHVGKWVRDSLSKIIANRPEDPIQFLASYFESIREKGNRVVRAHQVLYLTHHSRLAFEDNVATAYQILSTPSSSKHSFGLTGSAYKELLRKILRFVPETVEDDIMRKIGPRDHEFIPLDVFHHGILTAFVLIDFLQQSEGLYNCLDSHSNGQVPHILCEAVLHELKESVTSTSTEPISILQAGARLNESQILHCLEEAETEAKSNLSGSMSSDEFIRHATDIFLEKVRPIR